MNENDNNQENPDTQPMLSDIFLGLSLTQEMMMINAIVF
jgi:hypothetical protein